MTATVPEPEQAQLLREVANVLAVLRDGWGPKTELDQMVAELAALNARRHTIRLMRRHLLRLKPWQFRRRARIRYQLAEIALTLADGPPPQYLRDNV